MTNSLLPALTTLQDDIAQRVDSIRSTQPDWPCRMGCDRCCHRLAEIPRLTLAEWELLRSGLMTLPKDLLETILQDIRSLAQQTSRPLTCPLLDQSTGACRVYAYRPIACRTYGFYVQRELGLYCSDIETQVANGALAEVIWGNQDVIEQRLRQLGEARELTAWLAKDFHMIVDKQAPAPPEKTV